MTVDRVQATEEATGEDNGLWMVQVTVWVHADTAARAESVVRAHAGHQPDGWGEPMIDAVTGWNPAG